MISFSLRVLLENFLNYKYACQIGAWCCCNLLHGVGATQVNSPSQHCQQTPRTTGESKNYTKNMESSSRWSATIFFTITTPVSIVAKANVLSTIIWYAAHSLHEFQFILKLCNCINKLHWRQPEMQLSTNTVRFHELFFVRMWRPCNLLM